MNNDDTVNRISNEPPEPVDLSKSNDRFQVKIVEGVPVIRDRATEMIYRMHIPAETYALVHLINTLVNPPKKKRKRRPKKDKYHPVDVAILGGDPSL